MIDIKAYMRELVETLKTVFEKKLLYVGLQGSYLRDEATEKVILMLWLLLTK